MSVPAAFTVDDWSLEISSSGTGTGTPVALTPLNLFLVRISLPDVPATDADPDPAATTFQGLNMQPGGQLNMQPFPE